MSHAFIIHHQRGAQSITSWLVGLQRCGVANGGSKKNANHYVHNIYFSYSLVATLAILSCFVGIYLFFCQSCERLLRRGVRELLANYCDMLMKNSSDKMTDEVQGLTCGVKARGISPKHCHTNFPVPISPAEFFRIHDAQYHAAQKTGGQTPQGVSS